MRDTQRQKLYDAEHFAPEGRHFKSVGEMQTYVDNLIGQRWFQARWGRPRITVTPGYRRRRGGATTTWVGYDIKMPVWTRFERYLLHEVAHCLCMDMLHGPQYAATLLALVKHQMGDEAAAKLKEGYRAKRVKHRVALPKPNPAKVRTKKAVVEKLRAEQRRPVGRSEAREAAAAIRRAAATGVFGPGGCKPRTHALATARALEAHADRPVQVSRNAAGGR